MESKQIGQNVNQEGNTNQNQSSQNRNQDQNHGNRGYNKRGRGNRGRYNNRGSRRGNNQYNNQSGFNTMIQRANNQQYYNPYMQQQILYRTEMYIYSTYRNLIDINAKNSKVPQEINNNCQFFVIKSFS